MWTKSQKISAAVLGLAVIAFGVDRWVLDGGGGGAPAQGSAEEFVVNRTSPPASTTAPAVASNGARQVVPAKKVDHAVEFVRTHALTAVLKNKDGGMAII